MAVYQSRWVSVYAGLRKATRRLLGGASIASVIASGTVANPVGVVLGIGDSIMYGYPSEVAPIDSMGFPSTVTAINLGISGVMAATLLTKAQNGDYDSYYSTTKPTIAILQAVGNDIGHNNYGQASDIYNNIQTVMIKLLQSKGMYVAIGTEIPVQMYNSGLAWTQACEDQRIAYNNLVRANSAGADYVIDWAANPTIGDAANVNSNTAWYVDGVHPTQAGYNALIPQYRQVVNALIGNPVRQPTSGSSTGGSSSTATTLTLTSPTNPTTSGQNANLIATVSKSQATGTVTFNENGNAIGTANLVNGVASLNISTLSVGSHSIVASYPGDSTYSGSTSSALVQTVNAASSKTATTTTLASSENPANVGDTVTLTATVSNTAATGSVAFADAGTSIGTANLSNGVATLTTSSLAAGSHSIVASYAGDTTYAASASSALAQTVSAASGTPAVATTLNTTPLKQPNGATWVYSNGNMTITPSAGDTYPSQGTVLTVNAIVGKRVFAAKCDANPNTFGFIGLNTSVLTGSGATVGTDTNGMAAYTSIGVYTNNGNVNGNFKYTTGDVVGVVVDQTNARAWWTKDGAAYYGSASANGVTGPYTLAQINADPTTGLDISSIIAKGTIYGAVGERDNPGHGWTLQAAWPWTMPTGFSLL